MLFSLGEVELLDMEVPEVRFVVVCVVLQLLAASLVDEHVLLGAFPHMLVGFQLPAVLLVFGLYPFTLFVHCLHVLL